MNSENTHTSTSKQKVVIDVIKLRGNRQYANLQHLIAWVELNRRKTTNADKQQVLNDLQKSLENLCK